MRYVCVLLLMLYKLTLSKIVGNDCKFSPTCSVYSMEAYLQHGFFVGTYLTAKRLFRCSPWGSGGFDAVPFNKRGKIRWSL